MNSNLSDYRYMLETVKKQLHYIDLETGGNNRYKEYARRRVKVK